MLNGEKKREEDRITHGWPPLPSPEFLNLPNKNKCLLLLRTNDEVAPACTSMAVYMSFCPENC